MEIMVMFVMY